MLLQTKIQTDKSLVVVSNIEIELIPIGAALRGIGESPNVVQKSINQWWIENGELETTPTKQADVVVTATKQDEPEQIADKDESPSKKQKTK